MDSTESDTIPPTTHTDVAIVDSGVDPGVDMALPTLYVTVLNAPSRRHQPVAKETPTHHSYPLNGTAKVPQGIFVTDPKYPWPSKMEKFKRNLHKVTLPDTPKETALVTALDTDVNVSKPVDSSMHSPPKISDAPLGEVDNVVDNTFTSSTSVPFVHNNLFVVLDNAEASEPPTVLPAMELVFTNSPLPSSASAPHDTVPGQSRDLFVEESTQRSHGGRPLKPSQRLKDIE
ncbi:hypothetical protein Bca4012_026131 [Brassica carinata]